MAKVLALTIEIVRAEKPTQPLNGLLANSQLASKADPDAPDRRHESGSALRSPIRVRFLSRFTICPVSPTILLLQMLELPFPVKRVFDDHGFLL